MEIKGKATRINLLDFKSVPMRAFHMSWFSFFLCFFSWFGIAPLMSVVRDEFGLTKEQIGNIIIASVSITIIARLFIGWLCDKIGPRLCYTFLLTLGSLPVMGIGLADSYESFLIFRLAIGAIGASFVITQYHTSVMFAPNCVGTANATSAGWGNLGGGVTQMVMPLVFAFFIYLGFDKGASWRLAMLVAGAVCFCMGIAYFFFTKDLPEGNFEDLKKSKAMEKDGAKGAFWIAVKDYRVWALFFIYAACFGIELTINNIAALYFKDYFGLGLKTAGLVAGLFGLMNIFARTTGGIIGDLFGKTGGLKGRVRWLFIALLVEAVALLIFSRMNVLPVAIGTMIIFSLFVQMSEGATYSVVPFINKKALGSVSGIVGAGGNMGAVAAGFLFRSPDITWPDSLMVLGFCVLAISFCTFFVRFSPEAEKVAKQDYDKALWERERLREENPGHKDWDFSTVFPRLAKLWEPMDFLRIYLGIALMIKGIYYITNMQELEMLTGNMGGYFNTIATWYVVFVHAVGGACLAMGFFTRAVSALNISVILGALIFVHQGSSLFGSDSSLQFSLLVLFSLVVLFWRGSGKFSIDYRLKQT